MSRTARGNSPTVTCPVLELLTEKAGKTLPAVTDKPPPRIDAGDVPKFLPEICRQHSVSISKADDIRESQGLEYRSKEWDDFHDHARISIESGNDGLKDEGKNDLESAARRRVRGFTAAQIFSTVLITNYNLRIIATFLDNELTAAATALRKSGPTVKIVRRRDRLWNNPYTKTTARESILALQLRGELMSPLRT